MASKCIINTRFHNGRPDSLRRRISDPEITISIIRIFASAAATNIKNIDAPEAYRLTKATCPGIPQTPKEVKNVIQKSKPDSRAMSAKPIIVLPSAIPGTFAASNIPVIRIFLTEISDKLTLL